MEFFIPHPSEPSRYCCYGHHPVRGYFADLYEVPATWQDYDPITDSFVDVVQPARVSDTYDALSSRYVVGNPIKGLVVWMSEQGLFCYDDLQDALEVLRERGSNGVPRRLRRVARVIQNLNDVAG